jgi:hypothetical protein
MSLNIKPKLTYGVIGGLLLAALELGLFVTKGDLYQNFAPRAELQGRLDAIDQKIDKIMEIMINERKGGR